MLYINTKDFDEEVDYFLVYCYSDWNQYNGKRKKNETGQCEILKKIFMNGL